MMSDAEAVAAASLADRANLPVDWNHSTEYRARYGEDAPASGWVEELAVRQGSIWGRVEWTARGRQSIESKEYRYLSPVFLYDNASMEIRRLTSVALTNSPNLDMAALNQEEKPMEFLKSICRALGLSETSTDEQVLEKVKGIKADLETATNRAETPSLDKFVLRSDYDAALERATNAEQKLSEHQTQALNAEIDAEIDAEITKALEADKITPATKDYYKAQCRQEGGLEEFRKFVKAAPVVADNSGIQGDPSRSVPAVLERAGTKALFAADEFFAARISNPHTRRAYARVVRRFLTWCEDEHLELPQVSPGLAGRFIDELPGDSSTKNQALAALRHFFDTLVTRHAAPLNPFQSVRGRMGQ